MLRAAAVVALGAALFSAPSAQAVNVTLSASLAGKTPEIVGYNSGHFVTGSNTADWWRYSNVNGARVWPTPTVVEATDDIAPWGDGVSSQATFTARRDALRANPFNTAFINFNYFANNYANSPTTGSNIINLDYAFTQLQALRIEPVVEINYTNGSFPWNTAGTTAGWADRWEQWQHFYAQAFYLAQHYNIHRFEMYNEPNGDDIPEVEWQERLRFSSDAVQAAVADVDRLFGKSLVAEVQAPVTAGAPVSYYPTWGRPVVQDLHRNELGVVDSNFQVMQTYDYQRYDQTPDTFGSELSQIKGLVGTDAPGVPMRYAISEFNVHTASYFESHPTESLDEPADFSRFGSILAQLANNKPNELYIFKFSQGPGSTPGTVKMNGTHYVDNDSAPYNIGGETKGGEVVRLFAKAFAGAKDLFNVPAASGTGSTDLRLAASHDTQNDQYYFFSSNEATATRSLVVNLSSWGIAPGVRAIVQEVSADRQGEVSQIITVPQNGVLNLNQAAQSTILISIPKKAPTYAISVGASADAMVKAGVNANTNYGTNPNLLATNDDVDPAARSVSYIKFNTGAVATSEVQQAVLQLWGQNVGSASQVITHVYGITNDSWNESTITWNNAPNLYTTTSTALNDISQNFIKDIGNTAHIVGELTGINTIRQMSIDVTDFVRNHPDQQLSFLITREVRMDGENVDDALTSLQLASKEGGVNPGPQLFLTLSSFALPGDFNHDGVVDSADFIVWRKNVGTNNPDADGNRDGTVNSADYDLWRANIGHTLPGTAAGAGTASALPEPSAMILLGIAPVLWLTMSRRKLPGAVSNSSARSRAA